MNKIITSGKRKRAIARAVLVEGDGKVLLNKKNYKNLQVFDRLRIEEPLRIANEVLGGLKFDIEIGIHGGGEKGQIEAVRVAIARALVEASASKALRDAYVAYDRNLLVADVRRKEAYKPGDSKARKKRQTSYR